jgi:2'-5' RNA ligase
MPGRRYALVAYVKSPAGEFVENLRRELHPELPHLLAHLTILPPRPLLGSESAAVEALEQLCSQADAFEVNLGSVDTFTPITPTIYIRVDREASRMCDLHRYLNAQALEYKEEWPYIPHLTIAKMSTEKMALDAFQIARERWAQYSGTRRILLERLTFVREDAQNCWVDLASVLLGRKLISK